MYVDILQRLLPFASLIGEVDMVEVDAAIRHLHSGALRVYNVRLFLEDSTDTLCRGDTHDDHDNDDGQHHKGHENTHDVTK